MFVKLGITGKESSAFGGFAFPFGEGKRWGGSRFKFNFYFLGGDHFKYLYLCGGTPKIIKILVVVPQIIDGVPTPPDIFSWKSPNVKWAIFHLYHVMTRISYIWWYDAHFVLETSVCRKTCRSTRTHYTDSGPTKSFTPLCRVLSGEATNTNLLSLIWLNQDSNPWSTTLEASTLTITPPICMK